MRPDPTCRPANGVAPRLRRPVLEARTRPRGILCGPARLLPVALTALVLASATPAAAQTPQFFPFPAGVDASGGVATEPDGTVWFAGQQSSEAGPIVDLARLRPATATPSAPGIELFPQANNASCCSRQMRDLAFDPTGGRVWFARSDGIVGHGTTSAMVAGTAQGQSSVTVPGSVGLGGLALSADGSAWITERGVGRFDAAGYPGNRVAHVSPDLGVGELPNIARYDAQPLGITVTGSGATWFVENDAGNPGYRFGRVDGSSYTEYPVVPGSGTASGNALNGIAEAPDGSLWATNELKDTLERLDPAAGTFTSYSVNAMDPALAPGRPTSIRRAVDGTLWFTVIGGIGSPAANAVVRVDPQPTGPTATVHKLGAGRAPIGLATSATGDVWFTTTDQGSGPGPAIGRLAGVVATPGGTDPGTTPPGTTTPAPPSGETPPAGTTPGSPAPGTTAPSGTATAPVGPPAASAPTAKPLVVVGTGRAVAGAPTTREDTVSLNQRCVGPPQDRCSLVYLVSTNEFVTGFPGASSRSVHAAKRRRVTTTVARRTLTLRGGQSKKVELRLNRKARTTLRRKGRLRATLVVQQRGTNGKLRTVRSKKVTFRR